LKGGIEAWTASGRETDEIDSVSADEFADIYKRNNLIIKDVRKTTEFETGHLKDADNIPLAQISELMTEFDREKPNYVHCAGGYRSMVAASILKSRGYHNVVNIEGGYGAILKVGVV
jgi:hydroxyacylglutathione hydrolase